MVSVTGVAVNLASGATVQGDDVDYWIVPEGGSVSSVAVSVEGPQLGAVHETTARIAADDRVSYATPVELQILQVSTAESSEYVLAAGVIPPDGEREILGLPTQQLTPGDPHYANGSYDGPWTGEAVVSSAAAELLGSEEGATLTPTRASEGQTFQATTVAEGDLSGGVGPIPVILVHTSELQTLTNTAAQDQADQILVSTDDPAVESMLASIYPETQVLLRAGLGGSDLSTSSLPLAVAVAALLATVAIGTLFVATLMGLESIAARETIAVRAALGFSTRSQMLIVLAQTLTIAGLGGGVGTVLGLGGIYLLNSGATVVTSVGQIAAFHPGLLAYGPGVALLIGVLATPYPAWLAARTDHLEVLG
ncbi:FtsX-like permease family protein [Halorubrum laminariae]|uniref:FtsX-like permease family protein n=1 Tax=Halorubrum laminariae TaxID=1433523 RepID=A0ABD6BZL0_9EURY|nr:FtsX-like permease family protein [Halorubrum laminariae]